MLNISLQKLTNIWCAILELCIFKMNKNLVILLKSRNMHFKLFEIAFDLLSCSSKKAFLNLVNCIQAHFRTLQFYFENTFEN